MRIVGLIGYVAAIVAIAGVSMAAIEDAQERTRREDRALDAAINRIVDQQNERRAALKAERFAVSPAASAATARAETTASAPGSSGTRDVPELVKVEERLTKVDEKNSVLGRGKRAKARRSYGLQGITGALAAVPKFAVGTLLGLR